MIAIIILIICYVACKFLHESGLGTLDDSQKARLLDGFSSFRKWGLLSIFVAIFAGYFIAELLALDSSYTSTFRSFYLLSLIASYFTLAYKKLRKIEMPDEYISKWRLGIILIAIGLCAVFFIEEIDALILGE